MAYTSEIDKLEARFRDNPKGRNFAPLADAYRKAGLIDNAIDLCQNGLKLHPDYVSAYIVYANASDPAGISSVKANVNTFTSGQTALTLSVCATSCTVGGVDLNASSENDEQPARLAPATAITMTRRMSDPSLQAASRHNPAPGR